MLRKLLNRFSVALKLEALEPLLIRSGTSVVHGPDMAFIRTKRDGRPQPFVPGASLKGVLRSHAERIARTLRERSVCDVFDRQVDVQGCSWKSPSGNAYAASCAACRLFGSLNWKGRFHISDAYLTPEHAHVNPELRDGVGIDRVSGGASRGAKFDLEVMPAGVAFETQLKVVNFEMWQLGWLAYVLRDLADGRLHVGAATSRGLGRMRGHLSDMTLEYTGEPSALDTSLPGIGALLSSEEVDTYGLHDDDHVPLPDVASWGRPAGSLYSTLSVPAGDELKLLGELTPAWHTHVERLTPLS